MRHETSGGEAPIETGRGAAAALAIECGVCRSLAVVPAGAVDCPVCGASRPGLCPSMTTPPAGCSRVAEGDVVRLRVRGSPREASGALVILGGFAVVALAYWVASLFDHSAATRLAPIEETYVARTGLDLLVGAVAALFALGIAALAVWSLAAFVGSIEASVQRDRCVLLWRVGPFRRRRSWAADAPFMIEVEEARPGRSTLHVHGPLAPFGLAAFADEESRLWLGRALVCELARCGARSVAVTSPSGCRRQATAASLVLTARAGCAADRVHLGVAAFVFGAGALVFTVGTVMALLDVRGAADAAGLASESPPWLLLAVVAVPVAAIECVVLAALATSLVGSYRVELRPEAVLVSIGVGAIRRSWRISRTPSCTVAFFETRLSGPRARRRTRLRFGPTLVFGSLLRRDRLVWLAREVTRAAR